MSILNLTSEVFHSLIDENEIIFIDFWAGWCSPCNQFAKVYEHVAEQFSNITFAKINIEIEHELANYFQIRSIPHLMIIKDGIVIYSNAGSIPVSTLEELVNQSLAVDISTVRTELDRG